MSVVRVIKKQIIKKLFKGKVIFIYGARQVGKTTLCLEILGEMEDIGKSSIKFNFDDPDDVDLFVNKGLNDLIGLVDKYDLIFFDEAQKLSHIGNTLKLLVDHYKDNKQIIATGSSTFNLRDKTAEPLTGRKYSFTLYPLAYGELKSIRTNAEMVKNIENDLKYGYYPEIFLTVDFQEKIELLDELTDSYLYKDILEFQNIRNPQKLRGLLQALALQVGSEVSYTELSNRLGIDKHTVETYIDILEKNLIVFRLPAFSRNKRREISRGRKVFFYDLGVRNALIDDFRDFSLRSDKGHLWENYIVLERLKKLRYLKIKDQLYFWRKYEGQEIDLVEESISELKGFEIKYHLKGKKINAPKTWKSYGNSTFTGVDKCNYDEFLEYPKNSQ